MRTAILLLCLCRFVFASDELTVYELLTPASHKFAIIYDMATTAEGSPYLFNPIRRGSVASDERVIDAATGKELKFETVTYEAGEKPRTKRPPKRRRLFASHSRPSGL